MKWLLDTCVLSEFSKPTPEPAVVDWLRKQADADLAISVLTIGEIEKGIYRLPESAKKNRLLVWLESEVLGRFEDRIMAIDLAVVKQWARFQAETEKKGRSLAAIDGLLAATAQAHQMTLVTRNNPDMEATGVSLFNPWIS